MFQGANVPALGGSNATVTTTQIRGHQSQQAVVTDLSNGGTFGILQWVDYSDNVLIDFQVSGGDGVALAQLRDVAEHLTYNSKAIDCVNQGNLKTAGHCAPGTATSPPANPVPAGYAVIARGSANGKPWVLSGLVGTKEFPVGLGHPQPSVPQPSSVHGIFANLYYDNSLLTDDSLVEEPPGLPYPTDTLGLSLATAPNGQRFLLVLTTDQVTNIAVRSDGGTIVRATPLHRHLANHAVFVLSLGQVHGICDELCRGKVTVNFYHGTKLLPVSLGGCGVHISDSGCGGSVGRLPSSPSTEGSKASK